MQYNSNCKKYMNLITSQEILAKYIPNVLASVKGETSLFDKLTPALRMSEHWVLKDFLGQELFDNICAADEGNLVRVYTSRIVVSDAFMNTVPSLDLVLTPNGFGIVSNSNIAPASRERVDKLIESLEMECDRAIHLLLQYLPSVAQWRNTEQCERFSSTMFPTLDVVDMLGISFPRWRKFIELSPSIEEIEQKIIAQYIGQEQMDVFRKEALSPSSTSLVMKTVIRSLRAYEVQILKNRLSATAPSVCTPPTALVDIVNIIRTHPDVFPEWHASSIADLFKPAIYENNKNDKGYWF